MKAKVTFEDETGSRKIILNIEQVGDELKIQKFTFPAVDPNNPNNLIAKLAGTLVNQLIK